MSIDVHSRTPTTAHDRIGIYGSGVVSPLGIGIDAFGESLARSMSAEADVSTMFADELPTERGFAIVDFKMKEHVDRKGIRFFDRPTCFGIIASGQALQASAGTEVDRVGLVLGTTTGSEKSTSDYSRDTLTQPKPYLVNPATFPNAVMNCAAGQAAIWHGLTGVNATVAGGQLAGIQALRYARNSITRGYSDVMVAGAVEEFSPQRAWGAFGLDREHPLVAGEGAATFLLAGDDSETAAKSNGPIAELLSAEVGHYGPDVRIRSAGLASVIDRAVERAGIDRSDVWIVATGETGTAAHDQVESDGVDTALPGVERLRIKLLNGETHAATGALALSAILAHHRRDPELHGRAAVLTAVSPDGAVAAAVIRGFHHG